MTSARLDSVYGLLSPQRASDLVACGLDLVALPPNIHSNPLPGRVVVLEYAMAGADALLSAYARMRADVGMILIGDDLPTPAVRSLMGFRAFDVAQTTTAPSGLSEAVKAMLGSLESDQTRKAERRSSCWVLRGAVGGAGVTTLAIEMAFAKYAEESSTSTCVIDLNFADGATAAFLDGERKLDIRGLCANPERIDETLLRAYAWQHEKGVHFLAAPRNPKADQHATVEGVLRLLDVTCAMFDHVIVDMPRHELPWTDPILAAADEVCVVSELTVPSLHAAADLCRDVDQIRDQSSQTRLILNRMFAKRSHRHSFPIAKAERAIHRRIDHTVRSDWDSARMAVNLGMPIAQVKAKSHVVQDVRHLVETLNTAATDAAMVAA